VVDAVLGQLSVQALPRSLHLGLVQHIGHHEQAGPYEFVDLISRQIKQISHE
jgi:hypothetical protein